MLEAFRKEDHISPFGIQVLIFLEGPGQILLQVVNGEGFCYPFMDNVSGFPLLQYGMDQNKDLKCEVKNDKKFT